MNLNEYMKQRNLSKYRLSKNSGIPYSTLTDILSGKARLEKCSAETVYKLSRELQVPMEQLLAPCFETRCSFELFKSNVCHRLKELGDVDYIIEVLEKDEIRRCYERKWYPEAFYLLAMLDYVSRENAVPLCDSYNDLRRQSLAEPLFPASIIAEATVVGDSTVKDRAKAMAIPEFLHFNIIESEVRSVV